MQSAMELRAAFKATEEDLEANRAGRLSRQQIHTIKSGARAAGMLVAGFFGIFFAAVTFAAVALSQVFMEIGSEDIGNILPAIIVPLIMLGVVWLGLGYAVLRGLRAVLLPRVPRLDYVTGPVVIGNPTDSGSEQEIEVGGQQFKISNYARHLIDPGQIYTIYYTTNDNTILVMEPGATAIYDSGLGSTTSPQEAERLQLQRLYRFTESDLGTNRLGMLSRDQVQRLKQESKGSEWGCILIALPIAVFPSIFIWSFGGNVWLGLGIFAALYAFLLVVSVQNTGEDQRKLARNDPGIVKIAEGPSKVEITHERVGGEHPHTNTYYHVFIGTMKFNLPEAQYYAFKEGTAYRVYFLPDFSDKIVSAEQIQ